MTSLRMSFPRAHPLPVAAVVGLLALSLVPRIASAAQTLVSDGASMNVQSSMVGSRFTPPDDAPPILRAAYGAPVEVEAYVGTKVIRQFLPFEGIRFFGIKDAFASAQLNASAAGGVGISGIHETLFREDRDDARMFAQAIFRSTVRNIGDSGGPVDFTLQIPQIELAVSPERDPLDATTPFLANVTGFFRIQHFTAPAPGVPGDTGALKNEFDLFDYSISFDQGSAEVLSVSDDLLADAGPVLAPRDCSDCVGLRFDPFEVTKTAVDDLLPGERLEYLYLMVVFTNQFGTAGLDGGAGVAAFYGDPLEIAGRSNTGRNHFVINNLTPSPVPLPGTLGLLVTGLLWLIQRRVRRS